MRNERAPIFSAVQLVPCSAVQLYKVYALSWKLNSDAQVSATEPENTMTLNPKPQHPKT